MYTGLRTQDMHDHRRCKGTGIACQTHWNVVVEHAGILSRQVPGGEVGAATRCSLHPDRAIWYRAKISIAAAVLVISGKRPDIYWMNR